MTQRLRPTTILAACWMFAQAVLIGCGPGGGEGPASAAPKPPSLRLHVGAASDLQAVFPSLISKYREIAPDVEIVATFGSSGQLAEQIKAGAPFALYLAANEAYVRDLATENYITPESVRPYAIGSLVLAFPRDANMPPARLEDLAWPKFRRISIANPDTAPYGAAARQALRKVNLWGQLRLNLVFAETVRQAVQFVETGNADAGLVGKAVANNNRLSIVEVDPALYDPIVQTLGVLAKAPDEAIPAAKAFADFLVGQTGRELLANAGFQLPSVSVASPAAPTESSGSRTPAPAPAKPSEGG